MYIKEECSVLAAWSGVMSMWHGMAWHGILIDMTAVSRAQRLFFSTTALFVKQLQSSARVTSSCCKTSHMLNAALRPTLSTRLLDRIEAARPPTKRMADSSPQQDVPVTARMSAPRCSLLDLPQELLEHICDYAYQHPGNSAVLFKNRWERRELERRSIDPQYEIVPFPPSKVHDFLVCKRFFLTSARSYSSRGRFEYVSLCNSDTLRRPQGFFCQWVTSLKMLFVDVYGFKREAFPSLRDVQLVVQAHFFYDLEPNTIFKRECSYQELKSSRMYNIVTRKFTGLQRFQIIPNYDCQVTGHHQQFRANLQRFDGLLKHSVLGNNAAALQGMETSNSGAMPLYFGSAVNIDISVSKLTTTRYAENQQKAIGASNLSFSKPKTLAAAKARHQHWRERNRMIDTCPPDMDLEAAESGFGSVSKHEAKRLKSMKLAEGIDLPGDVGGVAEMSSNNDGLPSNTVEATQRGSDTRAPNESGKDRFVELTTPSDETGVLIDDRIASDPSSTSRGQGRHLSEECQLSEPGLHSERLGAAAGRATNSLTARSGDQIPPYRQFRCDRLELHRSTATVADLLAQEKESWSDVHHLRNMFRGNSDELVEEASNFEILDASGPSARHIDEGAANFLEQRPVDHSIAPAVKVAASNMGYSREEPLPKSATTPNLRSGMEAHHARKSSKWRKPLTWLKKIGKEQGQ
ncbi:uncharacterized protein MYCFIDRAFT_179186 [Pseudocercospora fijiensis CIRAD86]|uniref:Uncharacterized protein n=1 Tax=Pseudocercospora fijiensis (strain CIRAD86) TaxID=383855 RepID=M3AKK2_PSEFD|nr:uncharacterized protein MYCFIDRAFT_179186 [Pseudocercospora fijiensis CIRAD86]EME77683.1 hypothetical protein MYCFIDRAFT_179186 [Pseudocercospora fijiensis CIRAD86]